MKSLYDLQAPKKTIGLTINGDLLTRAQELNIDLSLTLETALKEALLEQCASQWKTENRTAVKAYNDFVKDNSCFSDDYRNF